MAFFLPGEIHNTLNVTGDRAVVVRLESQKLDRVTRYQYNPEEGTVVVMDRYSRPPVAGGNRVSRKSAPLV